MDGKLILNGEEIDGSQWDQVDDIALNDNDLVINIKNRLLIDKSKSQSFVAEFDSEELEKLEELFRGLDVVPFQGKKVRCMFIIVGNQRPDSR